MSVLRSKRRISKSEFEHSFSKLYDFAVNESIKIPKRRRKWISNEIDNRMNEIYKRLINISEFYVKDADDRHAYISENAKAAINELNSLKKPLLIMWNIQHSKTKDMVKWVTQIKTEVMLLNRMHDDEDIESKIIILDWKAINSLVFLKNMSLLHRYTHGKVANANMAYDNTQGALLISLVNDAYSVHP